MTVSRGRRIGATLLLAVAVALAPAGTASANNFGSEEGPRVLGLLSGVWLTTNSTFLVGRVELTAAYSNAVQAVMSSQFDPTRLTVVVETAASCIGYDVCVFDHNWGDNGLHAWNACAGTTTGSHPNQRCSLQHVRINTLYNPPAEHVVCHEVGHSVGLRHSGDSGSCMNILSNSSVLTWHDKDHINAAY